MKRWLVIGVSTEVILLVWLAAAAPVFAGSAATAGARPATGAGLSNSIRGDATNAGPDSSQEVTAAFTATPTFGTLGDAAEASRATFLTSEPIEFNAILFESGLAGTTANLQLFLFDPKGQLVAGGFFINGVSAPSDRTGFFIQLDPRTLPARRYNWLMVIFDAFGNAFVTTFQALEVQ